MTDRIVLANAGGLAATAAIPWLIERRGVDVVAVVVGIGQRHALEGVRERALAAGAVRCHVLEAEDAFAREFVWPSVRAGADLALPSLAVSAPLIARSLADVARMEHAIGVAHAATGPGARQIEEALRALDARWRVHPTAVHEGRDATHLAAYLAAHGIEAPADQGLRADVSLWGRTVGGAGVSDPWAEVPEEAFAATRAAERCPDEPAVIDLAFEQGRPTAVNAVAMPLVDLFDCVGTIAGAHGVGRLEIVTRDEAGEPRRQVRESPALAVLRQGHRALQQLAHPADTDALRQHLGAQYTALLAEGRWYSPLRHTLDACVDAVEAPVSGTVRLSLFKGHCRTVGCRLERYDREARLAAMHAAS